MADGGLSPSEQAVVAEHALTCARCRELIAAIIRTTPEPPVRRAWWQMPSLRWLAPALATGLAVAVWVAVGDRQPNVTPVAVPTSAPAQSPTATLEKREIPAAPAPQERDEKADAEPARKAPSELKDNAATREGAKEKVRERSKSARTVDQVAAAKPREEALDKKAPTPAPVPQLAAAQPAAASPAPAAPPTPSVVAGAGRGGVAGGQVTTGQRETNGSVRRPGGVQRRRRNGGSADPRRHFTGRALALENQRRFGATLDRQRCHVDGSGHRHDRSAHGGLLAQSRHLLDRWRPGHRAGERRRPLLAAPQVSRSGAPRLGACHERRCRHGDDERRPNVCHHGPGADVGAEERVLGSRGSQGSKGSGFYGSAFGPPARDFHLPVLRVSLASSWKLVAGSWQLS